MKVRPIPDSALQGVVAILGPYCSGITPVKLVAALRNHDDQDQFNERLSPSPPQVVDKHKAAKMLGVTWYTVVRMIRADRLVGRKVGGQWRVRMDSILAVLGEIIESDSRSAGGQGYSCKSTSDKEVAMAKK